MFLRGVTVRLSKGTSISPCSGRSSCPPPPPQVSPKDRLLLAPGQGPTCHCGTLCCSSSSPTLWGPSPLTGHGASSLSKVFSISQKSAEKTAERAVGFSDGPDRLRQPKRESTVTPCGHLWKCSARGEERAGTTAVPWPFDPSNDCFTPSLISTGPPRGIWPPQDLLTVLFW